ncbi:PstS family phosphate ABC transporter substrate-binding protein [Fischerella thermalis]|uniref:PstS family phosphate ABC transporter substrate-binding protein n=1 Tax=Fischerella thermalis TaxID=372787 RepID=UPI0019F55C6F|nr:PstS family phosphate ABC transporter substrate-binding protein [Fischerella thermalis]MBF1988777.1 PstS family phosphate ABC transporter substrate-binding protein [Fischerella thermalis M58_A2018_009]MBF2061973.1 PstS family phosphate ABC transporter substrate-binding protein [Fischerella thermalis M66_A2018_004]
MVVKGIRLGLNRFTLMISLALSTATFAVSMPSVLSQGTNRITIDGSSTVYPITEAVAEDFQKNTGGRVKVTVGVSGTGGGFKKFCSGQTDISNASRPILAKEMQACNSAGIKYIELPVAYDALTVVVNPANTWAKSLTVAELKKIWEPAAQGKIKNWNQVRQGFPNAPLKLYGPGPDSGTFDYFTEAIVGKSKASRTDYTPSEDDNVLVQGVSRDKNALGYFGYAYYAPNKNRLKAVAINNGKATVAPSEQAVLNGSYQPLSRPIFIYVNAKSAQRKEVKDFVNFYLKNGAKYAREVKYIPLPSSAYNLALRHFQKPKLGTVFAGKEAVGLWIEQLLQREAQQ